MSDISKIQLNLIGFIERVSKAIPNYMAINNGKPYFFVPTGDYTDQEVSQYFNGDIRTVKQFLGQWQQYILKPTALIRQDKIDPYTNKPLPINIDLHHALFTRNDAKTLKQKIYIQSSLNVLAVEHYGHIEHEYKDRKQNYDIMVRLFDKELINQYIENFPSRFGKWNFTN